MNFQKFLNEKTKQGKSLTEIRSYLYTNYIKTVIEDTPLSKKRVMFISNRKKSNFENPISAETNGLITEYDEDSNEWKILSTPTPNFNSSYIKMSNMEYLYNQDLYTVYKVYDGTIINLYYYQDNWRISTNKGYDVTDLNINNEHSYKSLFDYISELYPNFSLSNLDMNRSYTLCLKYDKIHIFKEVKLTNNYLLYIQSVDLNNFKIYDDEDIGLPIQEKIKDLSFSKLFELKKKSDTAYRNYCKTGNKNYDHFYGFILKSNNINITKEYSYIYIESELMKNVRKLIYDFRFIPNNIKQLGLYNYDTILLNIIKNIILNNNDNIFNVYFPSYKEKYTIVKKFILNDLVSHIMSNIKVFNNNIDDIHSIQNDIKPLSDTNNIHIQQYNINEVNKLSIMIYNQILYNNININIPEGKSIINDLLDISYIVELYNCLYNLFT